MSKRLYAYVMSSYKYQDTGYYKLGVTDELNNCLDAANIGYPPNSQYAMYYLFVQEFYCETDDVRSYIEKFFMEYFNKFKIRGPWYTSMYYILKNKFIEFVQDPSMIDFRVGSIKLYQTREVQSRL